jgi:hypothetical protein
MKTQFRLSDFASVSTVSVVLLLGFTSPAKAQDSWQERMLFNPPASQLELEKRGRVMIYDGLKDTEIAQAMDTQFDRIQSMMFVRSVATDSDGGVQRDEETGDTVVEDDGC